MEKNSNNLTQMPILDEKRYVTVQKDSKNQETREMKVKDRFIIIGIIAVIIMFFSPFVVGIIDAFNHIFGDSILARVVIVTIWILVAFLIVRKFKKAIRLAKTVELGTAQRKEVKIIDFEYSKPQDDRWYYIILSDWEKKYKSFYHEWAKIIGKTDEELKNDKFYEEHWITLNLQDRYAIKKHLEERIFDLELQKKEVNGFEKLKLDSEIEELKYKKNDIEQYHLHTKELDFYIWDTYTVLIDPDDNDNYILEMDKLEVDKW